MNVYEGDAPYVFVSYAHADQNIVLPIISAMIKKGYRIWYDIGINASDEWPEVIAQRLFNSFSVVFFVSKSFCESKNCRREVNFAVDKEKQMFCILLDDYIPSLGMQLQLGTIQSVKYDNKDMELFVERLINNKVFSDESLKMSSEEVKNVFEADIVYESLINQMTIAIGIVKYDGKVLMLQIETINGHQGHDLRPSSAKTAARK